MKLLNAQLINSFVTEVARSKTKYSRVALTGAQKKDLMSVDNPSLTNKDLARLFHCGESTVSEILAKKEQWLSIDETSLAGRSKRRRQSEYPDIEEAMGLWVENAVRDNITLTDHIVKRKAKQFATLGEFEFVNIEQT